jgi:GNAT superfamily N-acetyltransferase
VSNGWLRVPFIALARQCRGWGYGSEAVRLVEEWALRTGIAHRFRVDIDVRNGLGLYFWLRLGYRPHAAPENGKAAVMMIREVEAGTRVSRAQ